MPHSSMEKIVIVGAGGFGREVLWLIRDINRHTPTWDVVGVIDDYHQGPEVDGVPLLGTLECCRDHTDCRFVVAFGSPEAKRSVVSEHLRNARFATLVHPTAIVADTATIGEGVVVCAYCIISINVHLGDHVGVNPASTVLHDTVVGDYTSIMPAANISGNVRIGEGVYIGTGAKIIHRVEVGGHSTIGAGAVVIRNVEEKQTAVGVPAKAKSGS